MIDSSNIGVAQLDDYKVIKEVRIRKDAFQVKMREAYTEDEISSVSVIITKKGSDTPLQSFCFEG